jgi:hypothetical protein
MFALSKPFSTAGAFKQSSLECPHTATVIALCKDKDSTGSVTLQRNGEAHVDWDLGSLDSHALTVGTESAIRALLAAGISF